MRRARAPARNRAPASPRERRMCGIVAACRPSGSAANIECETDLVHAAVERIRHRGPDGSGLRAAGDVVLGHCRLSIIDVAGGAQPLLNEDGRIALVCNGEIYNHVRFARALKRATRPHAHRLGGHRPSVRRVRRRVREGPWMACSPSCWSTAASCWLPAIRSASSRCTWASRTTGLSGLRQRSRRLPGCARGLTSFPGAPVYLRGRPGALVRSALARAGREARSLRRGGPRPGVGARRREAPHERRALRRLALRGARLEPDCRAHEAVRRRTPQFRRWRRGCARSPGGPAGGRAPRHPPSRIHLHARRRWSPPWTR